MASEKLYRNTLNLTIFQGTGPWTCTLLPNCFKRSLNVMSYECPLLWEVIWERPPHQGLGPLLFGGFFHAPKKFSNMQGLCDGAYTLSFLYQKSQEIIINIVFLTPGKCFQCQGRVWRRLFSIFHACPVFLKLFVVENHTPTHQTKTVHC